MTELLLYVRLLFTTVAMIDAENCEMICLEDPKSDPNRTIR